MFDRQRKASSALASRRRTRRTVWLTAQLYPGQVRSPQAVSRLPQFQVAAYSLLLLASLLSSGFQRTTDYLPLPKWRRHAARPSLLDLLNLLRHQVFARGVDAPIVNLDDFASAATPPAMKSSKLPMAAETLATLAA
jgi:hypothetical protein